MKKNKMPEGRFIVKVKVQVPLVFSGGGMECLVYNEDRSVYFMCPMPKDIMRRMNYETKVFFYARDGADHMLMLEERAPWQEW